MSRRNAFSIAGSVFVFVCVLAVFFLLCRFAEKFVGIVERLTLASAVPKCPQSGDHPYGNRPWFNFENSACGPLITHVRVFVLDDGTVGVRVPGGIEWGRRP